MRDTKLKRFLAKNQHTHRKLLNFTNRCSGKGSNVPKFDFQSQFSMSNNHWNLSEFFKEHIFGLLVFF